MFWHTVVYRHSNQAGISNPSSKLSQPIKTLSIHHKTNLNLFLTPELFLG